ncbi:MAG: RNA polymerase sigma factor [Deltaproteobacteria bacterium]|nr:RNA polymerase sigma factor [Deltaproteobacteria bacterium]
MSALPAPAVVQDERGLVAQLARGDLSALGALYDTYADDVRRFACRCLGGADAADDLTHDVFLALVDAAKRYDPAFPVRAFVLGIAAKLVLRRRRRLELAALWLRRLGDWLGTADRTNPEDRAAAREELARYAAALERLSADKRITVILADVEGLSGEQIAHALDIPVATVWSRLHYARAELRARLGLRRKP